ncbi:MAG: cysteine--tRNA ligase [Thermoplasmata archaeon]|nr:cysteine--tRNA ligase [Thermoplasmata archaeon]
MTLMIQNTLSGKLEEFVPLKEDEVGMYVCGINTYDDSHMGHAKAAVTFDVIRRHVEKKGYNVKYVINFTDIEDHCIERAIKLDWPLEKLTDKYIAEYHKDMGALGVKPADIYPVASHHMQDIIDAIQKLIDKGMAYESQGDVYFRVARVKNYGKLSKQKLEDMQAGARIDIDAKKENPMDFTLWKVKKEGEPFWSSPWSEGRPGWHIECSVMSMKYLGESFDLHGGGTELIFPHHENEILQSEAISGVEPFVKYWLHGGLMNVGEDKMSKSLNNFFTIKDVLKEFDPLVVRFFLLNTHYRKPIDFNDTALDEAKRSLGRLQNTLDNARVAQENADDSKSDDWVNRSTEAIKRFDKAMDNDFNSRDAIASLFDFSREVNKYLEMGNLSKESLEAIVGVFEEVDDRLTIFQESSGGLDNELVDNLMQVLIDLRQEAREKKDWALADSIRDKLKEMGITIEDTADGVRWKSS